MSLDGVCWYVRARDITVTGNESFANLNVLIKCYIEDIKEGRTVDSYRVN